MVVDTSVFDTTVGTTVGTMVVDTSVFDTTVGTTVGTIADALSLIQDHYYQRL
jgi:hypothetical protein